jgi:hypothetical protein
VGLPSGQQERQRIAKRITMAWILVLNRMKKPTLHVEEKPQPRNLQRADIAPTDGYALSNKLCQ